jgi:hypothetical protein
VNASTEGSGGTPWLLLIHQIPPKPDYLRVKIGRRLQRIGAVAVKNSVYVLPHRPSSLEDFQWIRTEIVDGGGDASICQAAFVDGLTDSGIELVFRETRDAEYAEIAEAARELRGRVRKRDHETEQSPTRADDELARLRNRFTKVVSTDFFGAAGRMMAEDALRLVAEELTPRTMDSAEAITPDRGAATYRGRTWVTRAGVFVDRMASAWLIRRFIDRDARFRFVEEGTHKPVRGELRFDMFEGEFTHEGDRCTFETLLNRFRLHDRALHAIGEVVHDIDLKDEKFARDDAAGIERVFAAIAASTSDDMARVERAGQVLDDLHALFASTSRE